MASPDNHHPASCYFADPLLQIFSRDDYALVTRALQMSFSSSPSPAPDSPPPLLTTTPTPPAPRSHLHPKRRRIPPLTTKRKSRASKRSNTTFITADPANFRQMVQQVTGVGIGTHLPVLKPEPQRIITSCAGRLPTLDTSEYLLLDDQHQDQYASFPTPASLLAHDGGLIHFQPVGLETLPVFPTLESWEVM